MKTVGAYEAKTHLPSLLEEVAQGARITITKHGVPVALLVPPVSVKETPVMTIVEELRRFRKGKTLGDLQLRALREEGRR
jgi:prevent-host-death family protein